MLHDVLRKEDGTFRDGLPVCDLIRRPLLVREALFDECFDFRGGAR